MPDRKRRILSEIEAVRRAELRSFAIWMLAAPLGFLPAVAPRLWMSPANIEVFATVFYAMLGAPLVAILVGNVYLITRYRAYGRLAKRHDGRLCRRCLYPLDLVGVGTCTECGLLQNADETAAAWLRFARGKRVPHPRN